MEEFSNIWSDFSGSTQQVTFELKLLTEKPVHVRQYPLHLAVQADIVKEVTEMLKRDRRLLTTLRWW